MSSEVFFIIIQFVVLLLSLSIHESAHAWTADALGDPTARYLGRVSLNPLVHADPFGTILFPLMGMFLLRGAMFGWAKPVPVNISRLRNPTRDHMLVAAAGPVSNMLLAGRLLIFLLIAKTISTHAGLVLNGIAAGEFLLSLNFCDFDIPIAKLIPDKFIEFFGDNLEVIIVVSFLHTPQ